MNNIEHLIENTLVYLAKNPKATYLDIVDHVKKDINYGDSYIDARDICYICFYVRFIYIRSLLSEIKSDIKETMGHAKSIKTAELDKILERHLSGGET